MRPPEGTMTMFTMDNTNGFTPADLVLMNEALAVLISSGIDEKNASAIINNNWTDGENTIESLTRVHDKS